MRIAVKDLRNMIHEALSEALDEPDDSGHIEWPRAGRTIELARPTRVTPAAMGGKEGGEDSAASQRRAKPRGTSVGESLPGGTHGLPAGTLLKVMRSGKNDAIVLPLGKDGDPYIDPRTHDVIGLVKMHINKVCPHCAGVYKAGKPKKDPPVGQDRIAQLRAQIARRQKELEDMEAAMAADNPWEEKTDPEGF